MLLYVYQYEKGNFMIKSTRIKIKSSAVSQTLKSMSYLVEQYNILFTLEKIKLKIKLANDYESLKKVFELAYEVYSEKGYAQNHTTKMETSPFDSQSNSLILLAENEKNEAVGSITLYIDSECNLPADNVFHNELSELRKQRIKFAEVSRFVIRQDYQYQKEILARFMNLSYIYCDRVMNCDEAIIEVNPRHSDYYRKLLGFERFGDIKECPRVNNAPAILLRCSMKRYSNAIDFGVVEDRSLYNFFISKEKESGIIKQLKAKQSMSFADQKYFGLI